MRDVLNELFGLAVNMDKVSIGFHPWVIAAVGWLLYFKTFFRRKK